MARVNEVYNAQGSVLMRSGATGMKAPMAVARPVTHASRTGVLVASPILSSSRTFSSSAFSGSDMTWRASSADWSSVCLRLVEQAGFFRFRPA
jgi:hypothetical protein